MDFAGPYCYTLLLSGSKSKRFIKKKIFNGAKSKFRAPVTSSKLPKLYILKSAGKIAYVGYTNQSISSRLSGGLKADGQGYYYGYQWKNNSKVDLVVFCFEKLRGEDEDLRLFVEAIEAEIVYLVRKNTGEWPGCQNEIHFSNRAKEKAISISEKIYASLNMM